MKPALSLPPAWPVRTTAPILVACAAPPERVAGRATPAPAHWHAPLPHGGDTAALCDRWSRFDDPLLQQLIDDAQRSQPGLQQAQARIRRARAALRGAQAGYTRRSTASRARRASTANTREEALPRLDAAARREDDALRAAQGFREFFAAAQARWEIGAGSLMDQEEARRTALAAQTAPVGAQRERVAAWVQLSRAVGGG